MPFTTPTRNGRPYDAGDVTVQLLPSFLAAGLPSEHVADSMSPTICGTEYTPSALCETTPAKSHTLARLLECSQAVAQGRASAELFFQMWIAAVYETEPDRETASLDSEKAGRDRETDRERSPKRAEAALQSGCFWADESVRHRAAAEFASVVGGTVVHTGAPPLGVRWRHRRSEGRNESTEIVQASGSDTQRLCLPQPLYLVDGAAPTMDTSVCGCGRLCAGASSEWSDEEAKRLDRSSSILGQTLPVGLQKKRQTTHDGSSSKYLDVRGSLVEGPTQTANWHITTGDAMRALKTTPWNLVVYRNKSPLFNAPLTSVAFSATTTERGPCIYVYGDRFVCELQCDPDVSRQAQWIKVLRLGGARFLSFNACYRVTRRIGSGSFAQVYAAVNRLSTNHDEVVIKAIEKTRLRQANAFTEVQVLRRVCHPAIVNVLGAFENGMCVYAHTSYCVCMHTLDTVRI